jgi:hypothetical protein
MLLSNAELQFQNSNILMDIDNAVSEIQADLTNLPSENLDVMREKLLVNNKIFVTVKIH